MSISNTHFQYDNCTLCPRQCQVNRNNNQIGICGQTSTLSIARAALHYWEEPCISGTEGSGAVFFSGCNLKCIFCQNADLSKSLIGRNISVSQLSDIFLSLEEQKANNINLVTPGHFIPSIARAIELSRNCGLSIPIVYNTGSYELVSSLKMLDGLVDIYMPDLKYYSSEISNRLSMSPDYFSIASSAIEEMYRQTGPAVFEDDLMKKGILMRHLVLPGHTLDSRKILKYAFEKYGDNIFLSIMNQYTPMPAVSDIPELNKTLSSKSYNKVISYCIDMGITNAFIQEGPTCKDSFIPLWDYTGVPEKYIEE